MSTTTARDEILNMPAGRDMDEAVALAMGWRPDAYGGWYTMPGNILRTPRFSTNAKEALFPLDRWTGDVHTNRQNGQWWCELTQPSYEWEAWADTLPLAVCRAFLLAKCAESSK